MAEFQKPKDPNWVCTFSLKRNPDKNPGDNKPDLVLVDSGKINPKSGKPYRKNFTISEIWMEAACYIQEDKSLKITIKKTGTGNNVSTAPTASPALEEAPW